MAVCGRIIEVAGVSGVGKSTTCRALIEREGFRRSICPAMFTFFRKTGLARIFRLSAAVKFRTVLQVYLGRSEDCEAKGRRLTMSALVWKSLIAGERREYRAPDPAIEVLCVLGRIELLNFLGRIEVFFRNCDLVIDDGYVTRAASVWLRTPDGYRADVIDEYINVMNRSAACVFIESSPEEALRRAQIRGPVRAAFRIGMDEGVSEVDLLGKYEELHSVFNLLKGSHELCCIDVDESTSVDVQAEAVTRRVESLKLVGKTAVWVCC